MNNMFKDCKTLIYLDLGEFESNNDSIKDGIFNGIFEGVIYVLMKLEEILHLHLLIIL